VAGVIIGLVIIQRLLEIIWAKSNSRYLRKIGAIEFGASQYKYFIILHTSFFLVLIGEVYWLKGTENVISWLPLGIFILAQGLRVWCLSSLGRFWNTRVYVVPGLKPVVKGPYKYLRHPNYVAVILEIFFLPLIFGAYYTTAAFTILNGLLLRQRIHVEEQALQEIMNYQELMGERPRFIPKRIL
jgi:methyltransferase